MTLRVALRADASASIGTGHVMRCLTLADALVSRGEEPFLVTRSLPSGLAASAGSRGFAVVDLGPTAGTSDSRVPRATDERSDAADCISAMQAAGPMDRLIVDHYGLGSTYEREMRSVVPWIGVIDDLADREHDTDLLLDQNLFVDGPRRYDGLIPSTCVLLLGPRNALIREEFFRVRLTRKESERQVREILVFLGGGDPCGMTLRAIEALKSIDDKGIRFNVVVGEANPHRHVIEAACNRLHGGNLFVQTDRMAELTESADLAIGAAGSATWERCLLGVPTVLANFADNQLPVARELALAGASVDLGLRPRSAAIQEAIWGLLEDPVRLYAMSVAARRLMRGAHVGCGSELALRVSAGSARRQLRPMAPEDERRVLHWRNSKRVRSRMLHSEVIESQRHHKWFEEALGDPESVHWVFELDGVAVGLVYLDDVNRRDRTCRWGFYVGERGPRGLGASMCRVALQEIFGCERMRSVSSAVLRDNEASRRLHERLGFEQARERWQARSSGSVPVVELTLTRERWERIRRTEEGGSSTCDA